MQRTPRVAPRGAIINRKRHNCPDDRAARDIIPFDFVRTPDGRVAKCVILASSHTMGFDEVRMLADRMPPMSDLYEVVVDSLPWLPAAYFISTGSELSPKIVWTRLYQMGYDNDLKRRVLTSREHPYDSRCGGAMVRTWERCVLESVHDRINRRGVVTRNEATEWGI